MELIGFALGILWAMLGAYACFHRGRGYLWRIGIFGGPLMFLLPPGDGHAD